MLAGGAEARISPPKYSTVSLTLETNNYQVSNGPSLAGQTKSVDSSICGFVTFEAFTILTIENLNS